MKNENIDSLFEPVVGFVNLILIPDIVPILERLQII